jgi:hypothetical protein
MTFICPPHWRGKEEAAEGTAAGAKGAAENADLALIKKEKMPDGRTKLIYKEKATGKVVQKIE